MSDLYNQIFKLTVKQDVFCFYVMYGEIFKEISLPIEDVEDFKKFRLEYLKVFHVPAPSCNWIDILIKICETKKLEG